MNTLLHWNPIAEINEMQNRLANFFGRSYAREEGEGPGGFPEWSPLVDVSEDEQEFLIKAELPEVKKEDVKVVIEDGMVRISGERRLEKEEKDKRYHRLERSYGRFERSFAVPEAAKSEEMKAEYKDGLLCVHIPKKEEAATRTIEVKVD
jgi:HSP20 family protein